MSLIKDWYGTSCLLAKILISVSMLSGRRKVMISVDGFRFGKCTDFAFDQSKYSAESRLAQKPRSAVSFLKNGARGDPAYAGESVWILFAG